MAKNKAIFHGTKLSDNMEETPEGYLKCFNAVIARTGFQEYKGSELEDTEIKEIEGKLELDSIYNLYRPADEVFDKQTIASFEGKILTYTHNGGMLDVNTVDEHDCGHVFNVRKGVEALDDGNWPLVADVMVTDSSLIRKIKAGLRELSCGYNYHVAKVNGNLIQTGIIGNHVAVVESGRAGPLAKIQDASPVQLEKEKFSMAKFLTMINALGLKAFAVDAKPEDVAVALDELTNKPAVAKDAEPEVKPANNDAKTKDARSSLHDALDRMLDSREEEQGAMDAENEKAMDALKSLFNQAETEGNDSDDDEEDDTEGNDAEPEYEETEATDESVETSASKALSSSERTKSPAPSAVDSALIKLLKPIVAQSKDKKLKAAFDSAMKLNRGTKTSKGGYKAFARGAGAAGKDALMSEQSAQQKAVELANQAYAERRASRK